MCVYFIDLNIASYSDPFPLSKVDQFVDAYSNYNQIKMWTPNEEHIAFITNRGLYYYMVMPFGIKNVE